MKALREQVSRRVDVGGLAAQPVAHKHEPNGSVENGVKIFKGLFRVHLIALKKKISSHIPIDHPILSCMAEFVGDILTKYLQGADGKTAYERLYGKRFREEHLEFVVLWRKPRCQDYNVVKPAGSLESGSDGSGAHPTIWCLLATVSSSAEPSSACHWLTGGKVSWWTQCGRPDGPIQHQLLAPPRQQSTRVLPNLLPLHLAGSCPGC